MAVRMRTSEPGERKQVIMREAPLLCPIGRMAFQKEKTAMEMISNDLRIRTVLGRLEAIIDNENEKIGKDETFDLSASNAQKSRCLYELTMLERDMNASETKEMFTTRMRNLKEKLAVNAKKLSAHLDAVRSIVELLRSAAKNVEADGTYSQEQFRKVVMSPAV